MERFAEDAGPDGRAARTAVDARADPRARWSRARRRRAPSSATTSTTPKPHRDDSLAPRAGAVPRAQRGDSGPRTRTFAGSLHPAQRSTTPPEASFHGAGSREADNRPAAPRSRRHRRPPGLRGAASRSASASRRAGAPADAWLAETVRLTWRVKLHLAPDAGSARQGCARRRGRGDPRLRPQPQGPAAGRAGRARATMGLDPGPAHRRQGRGGRRHRQGAGHRTPSTRMRRRTSGTPRSPSSARRAARIGVRADQHRQRHRLARDRRARRRADRSAIPSSGWPRWWSARPGPRSIPPPSSPRRNCPSWTSRCAARSPSRGACRTRWPSWSRSSPRRSASASTSTTSTRCKLARALEAVVEDCVNAVGVDVNTASARAAGARLGPVAGAGREHRRHRDARRRLPHPPQAA